MPCQAGEFPNAVAYFLITRDDRPRDWPDPIAEVADEIVALSPNARKVAHWRGADNRATYINAIREFLEHARSAPASHAVATAVA